MRAKGIASVAARAAAAAVLAAFLLTVAVFAGENSESGLTRAQLAKLHELGFAVVPDPLPPGFRIKDVRVDTEGQKYSIEYVRPRDGATMLFSGSAQAQTAPKKHRGFFAGIGSTFANVTHSASTTSSSLRSTSSEQVTPEQEQELTSVESDSVLTGPIHFANDGGCLKGSADSSKALITNAHFTVQGCSMREPDPLIRAYKSFVRV
jgi:hypothetical protein